MLDPRQAHVAAIVLSYNGRDDTLDCIAALERSSWPHTSIVVVDNGSSDGSAEAVRRDHPDAHVIETGRNLGFAAGNNVGLRHALETGADFVLLVNNDAMVETETIATLVEEAGRRPRAGALCPLILFTEPPGVVWYAGAEHDPRKAHNGRQHGYGEANSGQFAEPRRVGRLSGAGALIPRAALEDVGLLDEDFFLHVEDTEWSLRLERAGWEIWMVPAAVMDHRVSVASGGEHSPTIAYYALRNTLEVGDRYAGDSGLRKAARRAATVAVHLVHTRRARRPLANARAVCQGWRHQRRGLLGRQDDPRPRTDAGPVPR